MQDLDSIKNIPSLNEYYRKVHFGFAAGRIRLEPSLMEECTDRRNFTAAEFPYEYFSALPEKIRKNLRKRFPALHCGNFFAPGQTALILGAGPHIRKEFIHTCTGIIRDLAACGIACGALDFSLPHILDNNDQIALAGSILRNLHPVLLETGVTLLLPVRLPFPVPEWKSRLSGFLRNLMISNVKLRLEIYPHELKPDFKPEVCADSLRLETASVVFCCNVDSGNRLLRPHLTPWLRYFALNGFRGPFLFAPFSQNNRLAVIESEAFSKLTEEICKNR